jgi:hypothetical protein
MRVVEHPPLDITVERCGALPMLGCLPGYHAGAG